MKSTHLRCLQKLSAQYVSDLIVQGEYSGPRGLVVSQVRRMVGSREHKARPFGMGEHELAEMKKG